MSGEKNKAPTEKKKKDSKKKGQVAISKDIQTIIKLSVFYLVFFSSIRSWDDELSQLLDMILTESQNNPWTLSSELFASAGWVMFFILLPIIGFGAVAGLVSTWIQTGLVIAPEAVQPSFSKLDPVGNVKNMLSKKSLIQLFASVMKVLTLTVVAYLIVSNAMNDLVLSYRVGVDGALNTLGTLLEDFTKWCMLIFLVWAAMDWAAVFTHHIKQISMSHQDIMDEHKETNGNPQFKSYRKKQHRSLLNSSLNRVGEAKAVVTNPTHIAVALDYEPGVHDLPYILAMGEDDDAMAIRREAEKLGIPVITNVKLARMLYADCEEDEYIQKQHLELAAVVFKAIIAAATQQETTTSKENGS